VHPVHEIITVDRFRIDVPEFGAGALTMRG
jgi:hypothetical protein